MPCDTRLKSKQTIQQRAEEVRAVVGLASDLLAAGRLKAFVDKKTGAIAFDGMNQYERDGVTDACMYRRLMVSGSALAKAKIMQAEQLAGRPVNRQALAQGVHSHDGGRTWHNGH